MHRRVGRAVGALFVIAFAAFGQQTGPALAVGTVAETQPAAASVSRTALGPYAAAQVAGLTTVDATTTTTTSDATTAATPAVSPAAPDGTGIPSTVLAAYKAAAAALAASNPGCRLPWNLVAGIGRVESGHASGGRVDGAGTTNGRILGPRLDGTTVGTATIRDTDGGALDGDAAFDRAVGPMQFIPGTWKSFAQDGNNDGVASPHNVFDATVAAGTYLCAGGGDLSQPAAQRAALLRYNRSDAYGALVLRWAAAYGAGVAVLPDGTGQVPSTTPTPPAQVPPPADTTLDAATAAALDAPRPAVRGPVASESDADTVVTTTVTTTPTTTSSTSTTTSTTTPAPVTTTTSTTTTSTTTTPTTPTSTSTSTTPTSSSSTQTSSSTSTTTSTTTTSDDPEPVATESSEESTEPEEEPETSAAAQSRAAADEGDSTTSSDEEPADESSDQPADEEPNGEE